MNDIITLNFQNRDIEDLLNNLLDKALALTNAQIGSSFMVDSESNRLRLVGSRGIEGLKKGTYINIDDSLIKYVISEKKPLLVQDIENDPRIQKKNNPKYGSPSFLSMPINLGQKGDVTAVLNLSHKKAGGTFDASDEGILSTMLVEIRLTLENELLQSQITDYIKDIEERNIKLEQEIAVRKQIETSLRESETKFRELADLLPLTVFETDLKGNLLFINKSAFELFGYTQVDFDKGLNAFQMFIPENRDRLRIDARRILDGEYAGRVEYTALKKDGATFPVFVYASKIIRDNDLYGLRGIAIDITELKMAEKTQQKLHEELMQAEKLAAVGACAAGIAHEVKNPLAVIIQGIEYLKTCTTSDPLLNDVMERIKKSAFRADSIVKGLLSFTRQVPIQPEEAEIIPIIEETLSFIEHQLNAKNITLIRQYPPHLPMINIDSNQIKQVFINILANSIEAMEKGGTITIGIENIKSGHKQECIQISFTDTGYGISEDKIEKVFEPFFTTKDKRGNAGLGLSIIKGIIDKHHGTIRIESKIQEGTKVVIGLPVIELQEKPMGTKER